MEKSEPMFLPLPWPPTGRLDEKKEARSGRRKGKKKGRECAIETLPPYLENITNQFGHLISVVPTPSSY